MNDGIKITAMPEHSGRSLSDYLHILIPVIADNTNKRIDFGYFLAILDNAIDQKISAAGGGGGSLEGETPSSSDLTSLLNRIASLESQMTRLYSTNTWPNHVITIQDPTSANATRKVYLPTAPDSEAVTEGMIVIQSSIAPDFNYYVTLNINSPLVNGTTVSTNVSVNVACERNNTTLLGSTSYIRAKVQGNIINGQQIWTLNSVTSDAFGPVNSLDSENLLRTTLITLSRNDISSTNELIIQVTGSIIVEEQEYPIQNGLAASFNVNTNVATGIGGYIILNNNGS